MNEGLLAAYLHGTSLCVLLLPFLANRLARRGWVPPGFCAQCRYNLKGNVSGRCPECGTVFDQEVAQSAQDD